MASGPPKPTSQSPLRPKLKSELPAYGDGAIAPIVQVAAEITAIQVVDWSTEVVLIESVEKVCPNRKATDLIDIESLCHAEIGVIGTWSPKGVFAQVPATVGHTKGEDCITPTWRGVTWHQETTWSCKRSQVSGDRIENQRSIRVNVRAVTAGAIAIGIYAREN